MSALDELLEKHAIETAALEARAKQLEAELKQVVDAVDTDDQYERRRFIREAAIRVYVQGMSETTPRERYTDRGERTIVMFTPLTCWQAAAALWDAKPEDC